MRPIVVQVGPLATPSATNIATAQRPRAAGALALIGTTSNKVSTSVAASQAPGAAALTINGTQAVAGVAGLTPFSTIYITSSGDDSGITFAVVGTGPNAIVLTETIHGTNAESTASVKQYATITSITPSGAVAANVTVGSYTKATLDTARRVLVTTTADESAKTLTITGTNQAGATISETMTGPNNTTGYTGQDFLTVTSITTSAALTADATVGTNGVASSPWVRWDEWAFPEATVACVVTGTVSYTVQDTFDDPNSLTNPVAPSLVTWFDSTDTNLVTATASKRGSYTAVPIFSRVTLNSESGTGHVISTFTQFANAILAV